MKLKNGSVRTGAYVLLDTLVQHGVKYIFGYPGGAILPIYDELYFWEKANLVKHILVRHEQAAIHAADAYARSSSKVGVCFATSGPGATNLVTGIATAKMDSIPLIIITGQVTRAFIGTDAFQETDIFGITLPIVKHSYTVRDTNMLPKIFSEAFFLAQNGRPGPVLIDIPKDVGLEEIKKYAYVKVPNLFFNHNYRTEQITQRAVITKTLDYLRESYKPLIYVGGGILRANAFKAVQQIAKLCQFPLLTTLMGKSAFNELDHLSLGMVGMHGTAYANFSISECDLLIAFGARFDDRVTGKLEEFACNAEVIHLDIDPAEISKNRSPQLSILGDLKNTLTEILSHQRKFSTLEKNQTRTWRKRINRWKQHYPLLSSQRLGDLNLSPQECISFIGKSYSKAFFTTDVGQHQMWAAQLINCQPKKWISSAGLGTMGFGLPAAIGAILANPQCPVVCITGDSSFQMNIQELGTIAQYELPIRIFIINNRCQGMVRQWQEAFYQNRYSNSLTTQGMPHFDQLAQAYGLIGYQLYQIDDLKNLLTNFGKIDDFFLVDILVTQTENCYPMVVPGRSNSQMLGL
jgi:acetolactate synthase-1/2/3 large subunit